VCKIKFTGKNDASVEIAMVQGLKSTVAKTLL
jgi:hypothetical protein